MEPFLLFAGTWWWIAPVVAGAGAMAYGALTTRPRRARRLELDAARHEEALAYRALQTSRANTRAAHADVLAAKARRGAPAAGAPSLYDAKRLLQSAKQQERASSLQLRAQRARVKAAMTQYSTTPAGSALPIETLLARHDAVTARWLSYETDPSLALTFPQMLNAQHPVTLAFLRAHQRANAQRPDVASRDRVTPEQYAAYRIAVREAESTLLAAERDAGRAARAEIPRTGTTPPS
ncbi:hypothetical protein [Microbacterium sp. NPDC076911]|uniref:hypothetical protein n=1 Tax=Microbacterium sp. NPDC076911 TaxID=3154958 RepID=UPI003439F104